MHAAEGNPAYQNPCPVLPLAAMGELAENSRQGFTAKKINSHLGWSEVNFKAVIGIGVSLRPKGIRSRCQSLNRYAYALNNPENLTDPLGLTSCTPQNYECGQNACSNLQFGQGKGQCLNGVNGVIAANTELGPAGWDPFEFTGFWDCPNGDCSYYDDLPAAIFADTLQVGALGATIGSLATLPQTLAPNSGCGVSSAGIDQYIAQAKPSSPLIGQGANFMATGLKYNLDPRLLVSLGGAETTFGTDITAGQFNALNVMYNGYNSNFSSFQSNINSAGRSLTNPANGYNLTNTSTMYSRYCSGSGCATGLKNLNTFMQQQGANTNALHDPCGPQG